MTAQHGDRDQISDGSSFGIALLDGVQGLLTDLQILLVLRVPLRHPGVEVPTVVIETRLASQLFDFFARLLLDI